MLLATHREAEWSLAAQKAAYAEQNATKLRAMLRDVKQALIKARGRALPWWLHDFGDLDKLVDEDGDVDSAPLMPPKKKARKQSPSPAVPAKQDSESLCLLTLHIFDSFNHFVFM